MTIEDGSNELDIVKSSGGADRHPAHRFEAAPTQMASLELRTLAPEYNEDHHRTYVARLHAAVEHPKNRNIALTGRYGIGKSSILEQFVKEQGDGDKRRKVLQISINTLGPDHDEDLTNRIQKELVKQLVYRPKPGELRTSRFARLPALTPLRTTLDAAAGAVVILGLLWLFGLRPEKNALGIDSYLVSMGAFFILVFASLWALRWYIGRRRVSQFSTGGTSITFEKDTDSYFDAYLDELVEFFERTGPDLVIFEDLDRFDDPQIFDSLRELNTLINTSAHWKNRADRPLRFIYAIKDSLFEKLGNEPLKKKAQPEQGQEGETKTRAGSEGVGANEPDAKATQAVKRANRTKFFEIVIPVVPFLSHSNARDLFLKEIEKMALPDGTEISRGLIDIVARHTTDMRLLINMLNEFVVYAERLLWINQPAPGITADQLFALIVYKNFHLADFEALPHRGSALDRLEASRRQLAHGAMAELRAERSWIAQGEAHRMRQSELAQVLGERLAAWLQLTETALSAAEAGTTPLDVKTIHEPSFWQAVAEADSVVMMFRSGYGAAKRADLERVKMLFPEVSDPLTWGDSPTPAELQRLADVDAEIAALRGADFKFLLENDGYQLNGQTFRAITERILPSDLARDLIAQGYVDRFYAEYSTVFYGEFLGVDVANFFRNCVWPNEMDPHFSFTTLEAVENILSQAPEDFLRSRSALNIEIVDHLMSSGGESSSDIIDFLAELSKEAREFLEVYLNAPHSHGEAVVSRLAAKPWPDVFDFLTSKDAADTDEARVKLLNAALSNAVDASTYNLDADTRALIAHLHAKIPAFTDSQPGTSEENLFSFLSIVLPSIPSLRALSQELRALAISAQNYELSPDNIRTGAALGDCDPITADKLIAHQAVWQHCADHIDDYLVLVQEDPHTESSCDSPGALTEVLNSQHTSWSSEQLEAFLRASSDDAAIPDINSLDHDVWPPAVACSRVIPNVANIASYSGTHGFDGALAALLVETSGSVVQIQDVKGANSDQLRDLVPRVINAALVLTPAQRVSLASQLMASPESPTLDITDIAAVPDELLAELLRAGLLEDTAATFAHFLSAGWKSIGPALRVSREASEFIEPQMACGYAAEILQDNQVPEATRRAILKRSDDFAAAEESGDDFWAAAPSAARALEVTLPWNSLKSAAPAATDPEDIIWHLLQLRSSTSPTQIMEVMALLPGDFEGFGGPSGHVFQVPDSPSLEGLLGHLKDTEKIGFPPGRPPKGYRKVRIK